MTEREKSFNPVTIGSWNFGSHYWMVDMCKSVSLNGHDTEVGLFLYTLSHFVFLSVIFNCFTPKSHPYWNGKYNPLQHNSSGSYSKE